MDPGWVIRKGFQLEILNGPSWGNYKGFWLESGMLRHLEEWMEVWSGGQKEDVNRSNGQVQAW